MQHGSRTQVLACLVIGAAMLAAGCTPVTYGTGRSPTLQTVEDIASIASVARKREEAEVDYKVRPGLVQPPRGNLPAPATEQASVARTDWPNDPDRLKKQIKAEQDRANAGLDSSEQARRDPGFRLPPRVEANTVGTYDQQMADRAAFKQMAEGSKAVAKGAPVDATGAPTRVYLTDPPVDYRRPDPNAPMGEAAKTEEKKKFSIKNLWPF